MVLTSLFPAFLLNTNGVLHTVNRVLAEIPHLLPVEAVLEVGHRFFVRSTALWPAVLYFLHTTELVILFSDIDPGDSFVDSILLLHKLCHSVFLGWAFLTSLINGAGWSRYFY